MLRSNQQILMFINLYLNIFHYHEDTKTYKQVSNDVGQQLTINSKASIDRGIRGAFMDWLYNHAIDFNSQAVLVAIRVFLTTIDKSET